MDNKFKVRCIHTTDANFTVGKVTEPYEFKVGDRVETEFGKGEIKYIASVGAIPYAVEHDSFMNNNCCDEYTKHGYGWWPRASEMTLIPKETPAQHNEKIIITNDGRITTAKLYDNKNLISTAKAVCAPTDTFDFATGAKLALDRLYKTNEVREVKRAANPGEWIKIVNDSGEYNDHYKNGRLLKVVEPPIPCLGTNGKAYYKSSEGCYADQCEYVVLENYTPPAEPVKPEYKAGDLARVVGNSCRHNFPLNTIIRLSNGFDSTGCNAELLDKSDWWSVHYTDIEPFDGRIIQ